MALKESIYNDDKHAGIGFSRLQVDNKVGGATITVGADAGTTITVTIQLNDASGNEIAARAALWAYFSDDANGDSIAGTGPTSIAIAADGVWQEVITDKAGWLVSEADGDISLTITEAGADVWYLVLVMPDGSLVVSDALTFAS